MVVRNKKVHKIERRAGLFPAVPVTEQQKKRVAAYARVSTDQDEQLSSYEAQVDFYTRYINNNPEWEFVAVYADEGISGTNTKKRDGFNRMVADALSGKIDLILTKSISRFARNTVDTLTTIRKLKEKGVEVYFEKENIYTLDSKGRIAADHYVLSGPGGKPLHQRKRDLGDTPQHGGGKGFLCLQALPRL